MDFGQVQNVNTLHKIDFSLPQARSLIREQREIKTEIRFGLPVFSEPKFKGSLYPQETDSKKLMQAYSKQFRFIELNSSFYAIPDPKLLLSWKEQVDPDFKFCIKAPRAISHEHRQDAIDSFFGVISAIKNQVAMVFIQLPEAQGPSEAMSLLLKLKHLKRSVPIGIEVRGPGFFENQRLKESWQRYLIQNRLHHCIVDTPGARYCVDPIAIGSRVLIRFLGSGQPEVDQPRIEAWVNRIHDWFAQGVKEVYFGIHLPDLLQTPKFSQSIIATWNQNTLTEPRLQVQNIEWIEPELFSD